MVEYNKILVFSYGKTASQSLFYSCLSREFCPSIQETYEEKNCCEKMKDNCLFSAITTFFK